MNCPHGVPIDGGPPCGACVRGEPARTRRRPHTFTMRLSDIEHARLEALARHHGVSCSDLLRMVLKENARRLGLEKTVR